MLTNALVGTLTDGNGLVINVYATELEGGGYTLSVQVVEGHADLRGFFVDGTTAVSFTMEGTAAALDTTLAKDVNMNGTGETFDAAYEIGTAGIGKDDIQEATFTFLGELADIDTLDFGIRATSTGELRDGSVKLVSQFDIPEPPPVTDNFPTFDKDISHITLYYAQDEGDVRGDFTETVNMGGKTVLVEAKDGYYTVKIDGWDDQAADGSDDLDDYLGDITTWLVANDPYIDADSELLGVAIKGGNVDNSDGYDNYYAMDGDTDVDTAPVDLADNKEIDQSYDYTDVFGSAAA